MKKFTIRKASNYKIYETPLFSVYAYRAKSERPMVIFSNTHDAVVVFLDRNKVADILKRKFKNHVDRRAENA